MAELVAEAGSAQDIGQRRRQEDALIAQFSAGAEPGVAVLSDGMGGHSDGDLAARVLVSEMFSELFLAAARRPGQLGEAFQGALTKANLRLKHLIGKGCISAGNPHAPVDRLRRAASGGCAGPGRRRHHPGAGLFLSGLVHARVLGPGARC